MSQTAAGGNYPQGLVTDWDLTGDLDLDFPTPKTGGSTGPSGGNSHDQNFFPFLKRHGQSDH